MKTTIDDILRDETKKKRLAKLLVLNGFRNTYLEDLHAGLVPHSKHDDKRDVVVFSPDGNEKFKEIPWKHLSRLDDDEMKKLMIECVNNVYTILENLTNPEFLEKLSKGLENHDFCPEWNEPELNLMDPETAKAFNSDRFRDSERVYFAAEAE